MLKAVCRHSPRSLAISLRRTQKAGATLLRPSFVSAIRLRARADRRVRHRDGPFGLLLLGETDALAGVGSGARDVVHLRQPTRCRCLAWLRRIRHEIRSALTGEGVLGFTAGARRYRRRRVCRYGDDGDRRRGCDSDRKSAGKYQSSCWKLQGRHHHAFCSCLANRSSREKLCRAASPLHALYEFPADGSSEVVAAEAIC